MTTLTACKSTLRAYIENSCQFEVRDENSLDDAARKMRDVCDEQGCSPEDLDAWQLDELIADYDL